MNRLAELNNGAASVSVGNASMYSNSGAEGAAAAGSPTTTTSDDDNPLEKFYVLVKEMQDAIKAIQDMTSDLKVKHENKLKILDEAKAVQASDEIQGIMKDIGKTMTLGKAKLDAISKGTAELKKTPEMEQNNAGVIKIQQNQHAHLVKLYMSAVQDYQNLQKETEKTYQEETKRRIKTAMREADGTTISDERAEELAKEAIEQGTENAVFQQAKDKLAQVIETRNDILKIESSMRELNDLFRQLAVLVNDQQEAMDNILVNVQNSVKYVQKGREELGKAKEYAKKGRKKMCWLLIAVFVIFMFILAVILGATVHF